MMNSNMRCPTLAELPLSLNNKTGWPWTEESMRLPDTMPSESSPWPRISILTPSYNQGQFIEETIRSVLLQGYPNLEYIIIDGGSTDCSIEIIKKYEPWLSYWVSEPDRGQSHAINKGLGQSTGEIVAWINSDDYYLPNAFRSVSPFFSSADWILGATQVVNSNGDLIKIYDPHNFTPIKAEDRCFKVSTSKNFPTAQPGNFWSKKMWDEIGSLNEKYHYCMDFEWMLRAMSAGYRPVLLSSALACQREQPDAKTVSQHRGFPLDRAYIFFDLGKKGVLKRTPSLIVSLGYFRKYTYRNLYDKSDALFRDGKRLSSLIVALCAWLISPKMVSRSFWARPRWKRLFHAPGSSE